MCSKVFGSHLHAWYMEISVVIACMLEGNFGCNYLHVGICMWLNGFMHMHETPSLHFRHRV